MEYGEKVLKYKDYVVFGKQSMPHFERVPKKYEQDEACFIFVNEGAFSVRSQDNFVDVDKDHAVLAKCMNYYFETNGEQRKIGEGIEVIGVIFYPELIKEIFEFDLSISTHVADFNIKQVVLDKLLINFRESINLLIENPEMVDEALVATKLKEFVLLVSKSQNAPSELDFLAAMFRPTEVEFKATIQQNLFANLSVDELAVLCHLSTSSFKRKFKEVFQHSPKKYILAKKVERAAEMLKSKELRVSDIAYDVGFDSLATFNRNFSTIYGQSPSEYRMS